MDISDILPDMSRPKPHYTFTTEHACTLGVDAAVVLGLVQELGALCGEAEPGQLRVAAREQQWLDWLPFMSPGRFMAAVDVLCDHGELVRAERNDDTLTLLLPDGDPAPVAVQQRQATPAARTELPRAPRRSPVDAQSGEEFDMPPPMPSLSPMLTDNTNQLPTQHSTRPRYNDEPLYAMNGQATDLKSTSESADKGTGTTSRGENTLMQLDWMPSEDCLSMIQTRGVDTEFAMAQRQSFVLYYRDSGQRNMSWDTKFFNWVCRRWQYHLNDQNHDSQTAQHQPDARERKQKLRAKLRDIGDLDW